MSLESVIVEFAIPFFKCFRGYSVSHTSNLELLFRERKCSLYAGVFTVSLISGHHNRENLK